MIIETNRDNVKEKPQYKGRAILRHDTVVESADEFFYTFLGKNSPYPVSELVAPEEKEEFLEAVEKAKNGETPYQLLHMKDSNDQYFCFLTYMKAADVYVDEIMTVSLVMYEVTSAMMHYETLQDNVRKYRKYMSLSDNYYYEYHPDTDLFSVYRYEQLENVNLIKTTLTEWEKHVFEDNLVLAEYEEGFKSFMAFLRNGTTDFHIQISMRDFFEKGYDTAVLVRGDHMFTKEKKIVVGTLVPLTRYDKSELEYSSEAKRDPLTGLMNKVSVREYMEVQIHDKKRHHFYVVISDVDDFKIFNEKFGSALADKAIRKIADIINSVTKDRGITGRISGDRFISVLHSVGNQEADIRLFLKTVNKKLKWEFEHDKDFAGTPVTLTSGISMFPKDGVHYRTLYDIAEKAMYIGKMKGKSRYIIYDEQKHGDIVSGNNGPSIEYVSTLEESNAKKFIAITNLILEMHENKAKNIDMVLLTIKDYFEVDGISIYQGSEWIRGHYIGNYTDPSEPFKPANPLEYLSLFSKEGYLCFNNVENIKFKSPDVYEKFIYQKIVSSLQVIEFGNNETPVIVGFDSFSKKKWSSSEKDSLYMLGKIIAKLFV